MVMTTDRIVNVAYSLGASPLWVFTCDALSKGMYKEALNCIHKEYALFAQRKANYQVEWNRYDHPLIFTLFEDNQLASHVANDMYFGFYEPACKRLEEAMESDE